MITLTNGNPQDLSGLIVPNGSITFQLNVDGTVIAAPYGIVLASKVVNFQFNKVGQIQPNNGAAAAQIYSNEELNPQNSIGLGTYYLVTFYDANGARLNVSPMWWQFPEPANTTVDISQMTPFATVGGNVIFYPTAFTIPPPSLITLGGIFANPGVTHEWVSAIDTDGTVTLTQPSAADLSNGTVGTGAVVLASALSGGLSGSITASQIAFGTGTNVLGGSSNFTWDNTDGILHITGNITINGSAVVADGFATKTSNYSLLATDFWVNVTGPTTITVPHAVVGHKWTIFNADATNTVTVVMDSGTISGAASIPVLPLTGTDVVADGTNGWAK